MEDIADWTREEEEDLFANLTNIAETNVPTRVSPMLSEEVFLNKLQESLENPRPLDQIMHKLQMHKKDNFHHIYIYGHRCMNLDADMKRAVERKLVALRLSTPRKLRSNSRKRLQSDRLSVTPARSTLPAKSVGPSPRRLTGLRGDSMDRVGVIRVITMVSEAVTNINYSNSWLQAKIHPEVGLD